MRNLPDGLLLCEFLGHDRGFPLFVQSRKWATGSFLSPISCSVFLKQSRDISFFIDIYSFGGGHLRQSRHGDDVTGEGNEETGTGGNKEAADGDLEMLRCA